MSSRVCLGKILTAHGVKGLVKVMCFGDDPESLEKYGPLFTGEEGRETVSLRLKSGAKGVFLAEIPGVQDRDAALALGGVMLYVARESLPEPEEGAYYHADLIGLEVIGDAGEPLGRVISVQNFGAGDLLEVAAPGGKPFFISFANEFVDRVEVKEKRIFVFVPEGGFPV